MNEAERWLVEWHNRRAGATSRAFSRCRPSGYEWLADLVQTGDQVLDLACGDGPLLEIMRLRGVTALTGVDMAPGELAAARARLGDGVGLVEARAQALPFPDGSFDLVTCHLALMLMDPVDDVAVEVKRVLRPSGRFGAVVGGGGRPAEDAWAKFVERLRKLEFAGPRIGDRRTYSEEGLREVMAGFTDVHVEEIVVDLSGTPDEVWTLFAESYNFELMKPEDLGPFKEGLRADCLSLLRPDGTVPCYLSLFALSATR